MALTHHSNAEPSPAATTGIQGVIFISPIQGGPVRKDAPDSKPLPDTIFIVKQGNQTVTTFTTDAQGHFSVSLSPGHYMVTRKDTQATGFYGPFEVDVAQGRMSDVHWQCDSGIR